MRNSETCTLFPGNYLQLKKNPAIKRRQVKEMVIQVGSKYMIRY